MGKNRNRNRDRKKGKGKNKNKENHGYWKENREKCKAEAEMKLKEEADLKKSIQENFNEEPKPFTAFLQNLPFEKSSSQLVQFLTDDLSDRLKISKEEAGAKILSCELMKNKKSPTKSSGQGWVVFLSKDDFEVLSQPPQLIFASRQVKIVENKGTSHRKRVSPNKSNFKLSDFLIGHSIITDSSILSFKSMSSFYHATLELMGFAKRQLAISFQCEKGEKYRVEFPMKYLRIIHVHRESHQTSLIIRIEKPPQLFIQEKNQSVEANFFQYNLGFEYERTVDFTREGLFGICTTYSVVVNSSIGEEVISAFRKFGLNPNNSKAQFHQSRNYSSILQGNHESYFSKLPFEILYYLDVLKSCHKLLIFDSKQASSLSKALHSIPKNEALRVLENFYYHHKVQDPASYLIKKIETISDPIMEDEDDFDDSDLIQRVYVTPLRICPQIPEYELSNRILRNFKNYKNRFLRVTFLDEYFGSILTAFNNKPTSQCFLTDFLLDLGFGQVTTSDPIERRVRSIVTDGMIVGGQRFKFLAYSNSQLREHGCWYYNEEGVDEDGFPPPTAEHIRSSIGNLSGINIPGKFGARLGQGFSTSIETETIKSSETVEIPDIEKNDYCFSDGVGTISLALAEDITKHLKANKHLNEAPSAFQIRFRGCKGVVSVTKDRNKRLLCLRPSMIKFVGNPAHDKLEILSYSKPIQCFLNRQVIALLSSRKVPDSTFLSLLKTMFDDLDKCLYDVRRAKELFQTYGSRNPVNTMILNSDFNFLNDHYFYGVIMALRNQLILDIQLKARIHVPKGITLLGIMDETYQLPPNTIFFQFRRNNDLISLPNGTEVIVYRCPSLHPGDIRKVYFYNLPQLSYLENVVVFSARGERPLPNEMSGGDLGGDLYSVIWDASLIPKDSPEPMDFRTISSVNKNVTEQNVTIEKIQKFFVDYIKNDNLGRIANSHLAWSDFEPEGAFSEKCLFLATKHSLLHSGKKHKKIKSDTFTSTDIAKLQLAKTMDFVFEARAIFFLKPPNKT